MFMFCCGLLVRRVKRCDLYRVLFNMRFLTIVIVVMAMSAKCQEFHIPISDTLNRFEDGKAVGYWVKYLDKNFEEGVKLKKAKHMAFCILLQRGYLLASHSQEGSVHISCMTVIQLKNLNSWVSP